MAAPEPELSRSPGTRERHLTVHATAFIYRGDTDPSAPGGLAAGNHDLVAERNWRVVADVEAAVGVSPDKTVAEVHGYPDVDTGVLGSSLAKRLPATSARLPGPAPTATPSVALMVGRPANASGAGRRAVSEPR